MPAWMLQIITVVSSAGGIGMTGAWLVAHSRANRAEAEVRQLKANRSVGSVHRCSEHDSIGIDPTDARSADLTAIRKRWEQPYRERTD